MNYTSQYNRGNLNVVHPQLEHALNEQKIGRKRFEVHKNEESSGLSYGYGLTAASNRLPAQDVYSKYMGGPSKADSAPDAYYKPAIKQADHKSEAILNNAVNNYNSKVGIDPSFTGNNVKYTENKPLSQKVSYDEPRYADPQGDGKYAQSYEEPKYEDAYYQNPNIGKEQNYKYPESYQKYQESDYQKYNENPNPKYPENPYEKYPDNPYSKYPENSNQKYQENPYERYPENEYSKYKANEYQENPKADDKSQGYVENKYEEPKYPEYADEIEKLKDELKRKEDELNMYQQSLNNRPSSIPKESEEQSSIYSRINKAMFDKQRVEDQKKINYSSLEYQINEKSRLKMMQQLEKEKEQATRLEMLKKQREDEARERFERMQRAKEYREQLEVQSLVKSNINHQEKIFYKNDIPRPHESPPRPQELAAPRSTNSIQTVSYSPAAPKFTKKTPKTICYNPITGVLKDTSQYVIGSYPGYNIKDPSITYLKNQSNIPELAAHPAFQQHKFTKNHPKLVQSFPITGSPGQNIPYEPKDEPPEPEYKQSDKHMAEYGSLMMQNRNPSYN